MSSLRCGVPESQVWGRGKGKGSGLRELHRQRPVVMGLDSTILQILFPKARMTEFQVHNLKLGLNCPAESEKVEVPSVNQVMQLW